MCIRDSSKGPAIGIDQQIKPAALHLVEACHQRFPSAAEMLIQQVARRQQQRCGADGELTSGSPDETAQAPVQHVIDGVGQMEASVAGCMQQHEMPSGVGSLIMALVQNGQPPATEVVAIGLQRCTVQQQSLTMDTHRPTGIRAEEQRILDQRHR